MGPGANPRSIHSWLPLLLALACALPCHARVFFVSQSQGSDANSGQSQQQPWQSLEKLLSVSLGPGDEVRLKRGDVWHETLIVRDSGSSNAPLRYTAYGTGALPVIDGTDSLASITSLGGSRYRAASAKPAEVVLIGGALGTRVESEATLQNHGDWTNGSGGVVFLAAVQPSSILAATRQFGIVMNLVHHVHFDSIEVRNAWDPVWIYNASDCRFEFMKVSQCAGFAGFFLAADTAGFGSRNTISECIVERQGGSTGSLTFGNSGTGVFVYGTGFSDDNIVENCLVSDSRHEGIAVLNGARHMVRGNTVSGCGSAGIRIVGEQAHSNVVERNEVFGNCRTQDDRFGIDLLIVGNNNVVRYNYVHEQEEVPGGEFHSGGIRFDGGDFTAEQNQTSTGNKAYYNVVYDEYIGINCFNVSHVDLINNTVIDCRNYAMAIHAVSNAVPEGNRALNNVLRMQHDGLFFENGVAGTVIDHNVYQGAPGTFFVSAGAFHTFATWRALRGFDLHGAQAALLLQDPVLLDFRPTLLSPAVDIGAAVGIATEDFSGVPLPQGDAVDAGAYELVQQGSPPEGEPGEGEGIVEGEGAGDGEGVVEGEGAIEGVAEGSEEGAAEGEDEGAQEGGPETSFHTADRNQDNVIALSELLRVTQLFAEGGLRCNPDAEDGYDAGILPRDCAPRSDDYAPQDWRIRFIELLRVVQLYNAGHYAADPGGEDGFRPEPQP